MNKKYFIGLKKINTDDIRIKLMDSNPSHLRYICICYVYYCAFQKGVVINNYDNFIKSVNLTDSIDRILSECLKNNDWELIASGILDSFTKDQILSFILYNNDVENYFKDSVISTPSSVIELACEILNIKDTDYVYDMCSGKCNFFIEACLHNNQATFRGIDFDSEAKDIATIRASILDMEFNISQKNVFEDSKTKANKIFANYPFGLSKYDINRYKEAIIESGLLDKVVIQKASSDWVFNCKIIQQLSDDGKAVAMMTKGATSNLHDAKIREYFINKGFIEAVISLPDKLIKNSLVSICLIVFSKNNKKIRLINAEEIYTVRHKNTIFTEENIQEIIDLLNNDSENSKCLDKKDLAENEYILDAKKYINIPQFKNKVEFGDIVKYITRGTQVKNFDEFISEIPTQYRFVTAANINDGFIVFNENQYLKNFPKKFYKYQVQNNNMILSKNGNPIFKSAIISKLNNEIVIARNNLFVIEFDEVKVNPLYIQALFESNLGIQILNMISTGTTIVTLSIEKLKKMIIPLPSMDEQNRIANIYIEKIKKIKDLKDELNILIDEKKNIIK